MALVAAASSGVLSSLAVAPGLATTLPDAFGATSGGVLVAGLALGVAALAFESGGERYGDIVESLDDPLFTIDGQDRFTFVNEAFVETFGGTATAVEGKHLSVAFREAAVEQLRDRAEAVRSGKDGDPVEIEVTASDGSTRRLAVQFHALDETGEVTGLARDVTGRTGPDSDDGQSRYERIVETIGDPVYVVDADGTFQFVNEALVEMTGYSREMLLGSDGSVVVPDEDVAAVEETLREMLREGRINDVVEMEYIDRDNERIAVENKITLLPHDDQFRGHAGVVRDISARQRRRAELEQYETIVEAMAEPIYVVESDGTIQFVNAAFEEKLGYDAETVERETLDLVDIVPDEDIDHVRAAVRRMLAERDDSDRATVETTLLTADGREIPVETNIAPIAPEETAEFDGTANVARDISEREERKQRLDVVTRVFRHNFRNALTVIKGGVLELQEEMPEPHLEYTDRILNEVATLESLSQKAYEVSSLLERKPERRPTDLVELVASILENFRQEYPEVDIVADTPDRMEAEAVVGIDFAIRNLVENAIEHNDTEGLRVEVSITAEDDEVVVSVADNGSGIPRDEIAVLEQGEEDALVHGSGIGLWAANWLVQRSWGEMTFGQSAMSGAEVRIRLRRVTEDGAE